MSICNPRFLAPAGLAAGVLVPLVLLGGLGGNSAAASKKVPTARQKFKNIQVLKNLPANQLIPTMRQFNASLGVQCGFCHVIGGNHGGFELDTKPTKRTARKMLLMVQDMNRREKVLGGGTTCFMCHHGRPEPERQAPPVAELPGSGGVAAGL